MATSSITTNVGRSDVANNLTTSDAGKVLDARKGKEIKDMLDTARVSNTASSFTQAWAFGYVINGVGIVVPIVSAKTITITTAEILNDSNAYKTLGTASITNYQFQRCILFQIPSSAGITAGKIYLVRLTGKVT